MTFKAMTAAAAVVSLAGPALGQGTSKPATPAATATMMDRSGTEVGRVDIYETLRGTLFHVEATGIPEGAHGFHVHQTGECSGDFSSAGAHYQPDGNAHGLMTAEGAHAGDLPNVFASPEGNIRADVTSAVLTVEGGPAPMADADGSAIILHASGDTYGAEAGAGDRIACGVVEPAS